MSRSLCRNHRRAVAGWSCEPCRAKLCAECVAEKMLDKLTVDVCATCGDRVAHIVHHRVDVASYGERLRTVWRYPLQYGGYVGLAGLGFLFGLGSTSPAFIGLGIGVLWGFIFLLIQSTAHGRDEIGPPDFSTFWESIVKVLVRAIGATSASWVLLIAYVWMTKPTFFDALVDPVMWLLVLFGLLYAPMAIMGAAVETPLWRVMNPVWLVRCVLRLGRDYWLAVAVLGLLTLLQCILVVVAIYIVTIPVPLVPFALAGAMLSYVPFLMARVVGLLLYVRGDKLGYGDENEYYERAVTAKPRGILPSREVPTFEVAQNTESNGSPKAIEVDF